MDANELNIQDEVRELRDRMRGEDGLVVSLYLDQGFRSDYESELNSLIREKKKQFKKYDFPNRRRKLTNRLFAELEERVEQLGRPEERGLFVCFCGEDFWKEYQLPFSLPSKLIVEPEPYIRPLIGVLEQYKRYCLVVVDRKEAKISTYHLGKFQETDVVLASGVPGQVSEDDTGKGARGSLKGKSGTGREAWGGWRETKIQHHIEDHLQRYLKNLSVKLFRFVRKRGIDYLVLAGPKGEKGEIINALKPHLHSDLKKKIIGAFPGDSRVEENELRERFHEVVKDFKHSRERKILERLLEEADRPSGLGVLGPEDTLVALRKGQVRILAIGQDSELAGWICPDDYYLSLEEESCPVCGSDLKLTEDMFGHMVWEAIDQRSEIRFVKTDENERFNEAQVGGLLRFR